MSPDPDYHSQSSSAAIRLLAMGEAYKCIAYAASLLQRSIPGSQLEEDGSFEDWCLLPNGDIVEVSWTEGGGLTFTFSQGTAKDR